MASLQFSYPPGTGDIQRSKNNYNQAVRIPGTQLVKISGQGGWNMDDFKMVGDGSAEQIEQAFSNVDTVLKHAGVKGGWGSVYLMRTYHTDIDDSLPKIVEATRKWCTNEPPVWTAIGVTRLGRKEMTIEVEVEAWDDGK